MINSLLELIGALFLAGLPIFLMLARIRRRRRVRAEAVTAGGREHDAPRWRSWLRGWWNRQPDSDLAPYPQQASGGQPQRGPTARRGESSETRSALESERTGGYRSLSPAAPPRNLIERVDRYPPLQRAIVLKEILGPPKGLDDHLPAGNT